MTRKKTNAAGAKILRDVGTLAASAAGLCEQLEGVSGQFAEVISRLIAGEPVNPEMLAVLRGALLEHQANIRVHQGYFKNVQTMMQRVVDAAAPSSRHAH